MKKTLKAIEAKEHEIIETVERPFEWVRDHWMTFTIVALALALGIGVWQYSAYTKRVELEAGWKALADLDDDEKASADPKVRIQRLQTILSEPLAESVRPFVQLELALAHKTNKQEVEARGILEEIVGSVSNPDHAVLHAAKSQLAAMDADEAWTKNHAVTPGASTTSGGENPRVVFHTSKGEVEIELFEDHAPNSTANIIELIESGWYTSCTVHRVEPPDTLGVVQFGRKFSLTADTSSVPEEGPGYRIRAEIHPELHHDEGTVAMARTASLDSAGAQIFINTRDNRASWDGKYTVIGKVTRGLDAVKNLVKEVDLILRAEVTSKRDHPYVVEKLPLEQ